MWKVIQRLAVLGLFGASVLGAQNWELTLSVTGDTLVPYEPVYARLVVANRDSAPIRAPDVTALAPEYLFHFSLTAVDGRTFRAGEMIPTTVDPLPKLAELTMPPGESLLTVLAELTTWQWIRNDPYPEPLPVGEYELRAELNGHRSNAVELVVRRWEGLSQDVFSAYREILYYSVSSAWMGASPELSTSMGRQSYRHAAVSRLAEEVLQGDSLGLFYSIDAQVWLMRAIPYDPYDRATGWKQSAAIRDSALSLYHSLGLRYPDSPTATYLLLHGSGFLPGEERVALLREVADKHPGRVIGREARLTLSQLYDRRRARGWPQ